MVFAMPLTRPLQTALLLLAVSAYPAAQSARAQLVGVVLNGQNQPLGGVTVTISGPPSLSIVSDDQGRFAFANLQPERYVIEASRPGFVSPRPVVMSVVPGQGVKGVQLHMVATGTISGVVLDQNGA